MSDFASSAEHFDFHPPTKGMARDDGGPTKDVGWRIIDLLQSQNKQRESMARRIEDAGKCVQDLLTKVILQHMTNGDKPTHDSKDTTQTLTNIKQRLLPALGD